MTQRAYPYAANPLTHERDVRSGNPCALHSANASSTRGGAMRKDWERFQDLASQLRDKSGNTGLLWAAAVIWRQQVRFTLQTGGASLRKREVHFDLSVYLDGCAIEGCRLIDPLLYCIDRGGSQ